MHSWVLSSWFNLVFMSFLVIGIAYAINYPDIDNSLLVPLCGSAPMMVFKLMETLFISLLSFPYFIILLLMLTIVCELYYLFVRFGLLRGRSLRTPSYSASLYLMPALILLWLGLNSSRMLVALDYPETLSDSNFEPDFMTVAGLIASYIYVGIFTGSEFGMFTWVSALALTLYRGLKYFVSSQGGPSQAVFSWIKSWPGWPGKAAEPADVPAGRELASLLFVPSLTVALSISDSVRRFSDLFLNDSALAFSLDAISLIVVAIVIGIGFHSMTACSLVEDPLHGKRQLLKYPKVVRLGSLGSSVFVLLLWSFAAGHESKSDLRIVANELPNPDGRNVSLTLINRGKDTQVLTELHVESRLNFFMYCMSAEFEVPVIGEYQVKFSIFQPLTTMKLKGEQIKQFPPNSPAQINIALEPDGTGYCGDNWKTEIRLLIVTDDGRRSPTPWFELERSSRSRPPTEFGRLWDLKKLGESESARMSH